MVDTFQIFLQTGSGFGDPRGLSYFTTKSQETVSDTLAELFRDMNKLANAKLGWTIGWDLTAAERTGRWTDQSSVIYFLRSPSQSLISKEGVVTNSSGGDAAGRTATTANGVLSEVYVENNMPADKLGHIAFHELMHNRLDVGATVIAMGSGDPSTAGIHNAASGGGGLAATPTTGFASLTAKNATLMAKNLVTKIRQNTRYLAS